MKVIQVNDVFIKKTIEKLLKLLKELRVLCMCIWYNLWYLFVF